MPPAEHMGRQSGWTQAPLVANTARRDALGLLPTFSAPELSETGSQGEGPAPSKKSNPPGSPRCAQNCDVRCPRDPALDTRPASGRKMARQREGQTVEGHAATCAYPPTPVTPCDVHPACSTPEEPAERELRDDIYVQRPQRASAAGRSPPERWWEAPGRPGPRRCSQGRWTQRAPALSHHLMLLNSVAGSRRSARDASKNACPVGSAPRRALPI